MISPATTGERPTATLTDSLLRISYASFALHTGFRRRLSLQRVTLCLWLVLHIIGMISVLKCAHGAIQSFSFFALLVSEIAFCGTVAFFTIHLIRNHDEVEPLIRRNSRRIGTLLRHVVYSMPIELVGLRQALGAVSTESLLKDIYFSLCQFWVMAFFLASHDVISNAQDANDMLLRLTNDIQANRREIWEQKWNLRDRVHSINKVFSWFWGMHHVLAYADGIFIIREMLSQASSSPTMFILSVSGVCLLLRLFDLDRESSKFTSQCMEIEGSLLGRHRIPAVRGKTMKRMLQALAFREEWDTFRCGSFVMSSRKFCSFLATGVTCAAVVFQFDHRVLRNISDLNAKAQ